MNFAGFFQSLSENPAVRGIGGVIGLIVSFVAIYKFFVEFVEPNEQAIRTRNNRPDYKHVPMSTTRRIMVFGGIITALVLVVLSTIMSSGVWYYLGGAVFGIVAFATGIITWKRTTAMAMTGPGIKGKVPGWFSWRRGVVAIETRGPELVNATDATGHIINIHLAYRWSRTSDDAPALWKSLNDIVNLETTMDYEVTVAAQNALKHVERAAMLDEDGLHAFAEQVYQRCKQDFYNKFGTTLYSVAVATIGIPPQVAGSEVLADALGSSDGVRHAVEMVAAATATQE